MTRLFEGPYGWVSDLIQKLAAAGLSAEHAKMLNGDPHLMREWIASLPDPENVVVPKPPVVAESRTPLKSVFPSGGIVFNALAKDMSLNWLEDVASLCEEELSAVRPFGDRRIQTVKDLLAEHGLQLREHDVSGCTFFPSYGRKPSALRRAQADGLKLSEIVSFWDFGFWAAPDQRTQGGWVPEESEVRRITLGEFKSMGHQQRLEILSPLGITKFEALIDRYQL